jgi:hypothetical protein
VRFFVSVRGNRKRTIVETERFDRFRTHWEHREFKLNINAGETPAVRSKDLPK